MTKDNTAKLARRLDRKISLSRLALFIELVWPRLWPPLVVISIFILVSLAGLWPVIPPWLHKTLLGLFAVLFFVSLFPLIRVRLPGRKQALRRLERNSGIRHRPASAYFDTLSQNKITKATAKLWTAHRRRMAQLFARMKAGWPHPRVDRYDPYAIRALVILLLVVSLIASGNRTWDRLASAFRMSSAVSIPHMRLDAWVTPPLYTGKPPILLTDGKKSLGAEESEARLTEVPEKSVLVIRVNGADENLPSIVLKNYMTKFSEELKPSENTSGSDVSEYRATLSEPASITVQNGFQNMYMWSFNILTDAPPKIELTEMPGKTQRGSIKLSYKVEDDYGVVEAKVRFDRPKVAEDGDRKESSKAAEPLGEPPVLPLPLPRANAKIAEAHTYKDLTSHPWAGLPVLMTLLAQDQAGQTTRSEPLKIILPERKFTKPLARAIVEQRRRLVADPSDGLDVAKALDALTIAPDKFYKDKSVYLGLRSAYWRLKYDKSREGVQSTVDQLWDIAIKIEDGELSDAERDLKMAQEKLMQALQENAPEDVIRKLIDELKNAVSRFLQALAKQAQQSPLAQMPNNDLNGNQMISPKDLEQMLKNIENLANMGSKDMAQQMLGQLRDLLENLRAGTMQPNKQAERMQNMMQDLGEIIRQQQKLLDDTFQEKRQDRSLRQGRGPRQDSDQQQQGRQQRQGQRLGEGRRPGNRPGQRQRDGQAQRPGSGEKPGQGGQGRIGELTDRQDKLVGRLERMLDGLREFGMKAPEQLEGAGQAMEDATEALQEENLGTATQQQTLALDRLRQSAQSLMQQMMQSMQSQMGQPNSRDPMGRPNKTFGPDLGTSVKVPDEIDIQRAREILEELRRKLSEPTRPTIELDYLERLLKRF